MPPGSSSPVVAGDNIVLTAYEGGKLYTIAYRRLDGGEAWRAEAPTETIEQYHKTEGSPAASSPATDGRRIVTYFGSCGLHCYDLEGRELWKHQLPAATTMWDFGTGVSPIIADGVVVLLRDETKDSKIIALDVGDGRVLWERKRESTTGYGTPVIWDTPAGKQVVAPGFGKLIGYDLHTGTETWHVEGMPSSCCTTPVTAEGGLYFAGWSPGDPTDADFKMPTFDRLLSEGDADHDGVLSKRESLNTSQKDFFDNNDPNKDGLITRAEWDGLLTLLATTKNTAFRLLPGGRGDITNTHVAWKKTKGLPYVPSGLVYRGQFVLVKDGGIVTAYDAQTGNEIYQKRAAASGGYYASPVAAGGNLYLTSLADGAITVLRAGVDSPQVVAANEPLGERVAATPAIAGNTLYVRTAGHLYAFAE